MSAPARSATPSTETRLEALESSLLVLSQKMETLRPLLHRVLENSQALQQQHQPAGGGAAASSSTASFGSQFLHDFFAEDDDEGGGGDISEDSQESQWTEEDFDASRPVAPYIGRFVRRCWEARGRAGRCRKARSAYPNPNLPFLKVPRLNPEFEGYSRFRAIGLDRGRDESFRCTQASVMGAVGALVDLLDCCDRSGPHVTRQAVAERTGAALAHLGRAFESLSEERRRSVLKRVAPDQRRLLDGLRPTGVGDREQSTEFLFGPRLRDRAAKRSELVSLLHFLRARGRQLQEQYQQQNGNAVQGPRRGASRRRPRTHFGAPIRRRRT
uniref:Uncharacterized protein n=1 Tax=Rhipicephalus appendiculatus TaxID=34631 RepID=A0A131YME0_RHIAP